MHHRPRRLAGAALTLVALVATAGCSGEPAEPAAAPEEGGWSFTDDLGTTVELDATPTRIAGLNDVIASLWNYGVQPVAGFGQTSAADDVAFEGRDLTDLEIVGESYGQIDLERLAAADPDLVVTSVYPTDSSGALDPNQPLYGFESLQQQEQVGRIAPIVAIAYRGSAADVIERTVQLAESLRADSAAIDAAREDYAVASAELTAAGARGITVLPVYATATDGWWMAKAPDDPALRLYSDLGVDFVDPGGDGYFWETTSWETTSWERVTDHPSDVILYSLRGGETPEQMRAQPTYPLLPAAQAGQEHPWEYVGMDHVAQAAYMSELAGWLTEARKVT